MDRKTCLMTIKKQYHTLTGVEQTVADYILQNSAEVINMPIDTLAGNAGVAKSAIIRLSKSLGFQGYSELKISLAMELSGNKKMNYIPYIDPNDDPATIMQKVFSANIKTLHDTCEKLDKVLLKQAVDMLSGEGIIYIYAIGTSASIAREFQYRLMQIGKTAFCINDAPTMKVSSLNIKENDVAIGISHSGRTIVTIEALQLAKKKGARTLCITSYPDSPITAHSDCTLEIYSDEIDYPMEAISSRIAHLSVIEAITIALSAQNFEDARSRAKETYELINTIRY